MVSLSKKELADEITAIKTSISAHEAQMKLHVYAIKVDKYLKELMEEKIKRFK